LELTLIKFLIFLLLVIFILNLQ